MSKRTRLLFYDASQNGASQQFLSLFWALWGAIGGFDFVVAITSTTQLADNVARKVPAGTLIDEWEFAGHGRSGKPLVNGLKLTPATIAGALERRTHSGTVGWLRCCDAYQGTEGQAFAVELVRQLRHPVAGHTRVVSQHRAGKTYGLGWWGKARAAADLAAAIAAGLLYQSGCYVLRPGADPHWSPEDEGYSGRKQPNTAFLTDRRPPAEAWAEAA